MGGILRYDIAKQYGTKKEDLAQFREDVKAHRRLSKRIEEAEESLEVAAGKTPRDPLFGWLCERMVETYEKHAGKPFTHERLRDEKDPRQAFRSAGAHFAANAIMHILSESEPTAAELDTAFANIVKNKKTYSDK